jgi:hypothetical protein
MVTPASVEDDLAAIPEDRVSIARQPARATVRA